MMIVGRYLPINHKFIEVVIHRDIFNINKDLLVQ